MREVINMANLRVRIDDELKEESAKILEELGLDLSTGIRIFLKQVVTERAIPFKITLTPPLINQALDDIKQGKVESFDSVAELFEDLENED